MKVAFLDRDGVINKEIDYLYKVEDFEYTKNCILGLKNLIKLGFHLIIVTNQAGIAKGLYSVEAFNNLMNWMSEDLAQYGVKITDILYCPHHIDGTIKNYAIECAYRKPEPGMFIKAKKRYNIDMINSIAIGDKWTDMQAAMSAGVNQLFLVKSGHTLDKVKYPGCRLAENLFEVSQILERENPIW